MEKKIEECLNKPTGLVHTYNPITGEGSWLLLVQGQPNPELVSFRAAWVSQLDFRLIK